MSSAALMSAASLLLVAAVVAAYLGRRSKPIAIGVGASVLVFVVLAAMFFLADRFTGHGIDQAVLYHVTYGLGGAGFSEYASLIVGGVALVVVGAVVATGCAFFLLRKSREQALPTSRASVPLALMACAFNPASRDLVELADVSNLFVGGGDDAQHASFKLNYRAPKLGSNPSPRRNFVFIYAEGLERTYLDEGRFPGLIRGIRELESIATTFTNMRQTNGTSFTIGGIVGSQCGIPLLTSSGGNTMGGMGKFLPNAVCMGDLLGARGYQLSYLGGAALSFAGKGKFLKGHGFDRVQGRDELADKLPDPSYMSGWGLHDDSLMDIAFDELTQLAAKHEPFGLFMLTLDTHHPNGHVSRRVADVKYEQGSVPILNAVAGSDRLLASFIRRVLDSPLGKDTVIVLCSDHLAMQNGATDRLSQGERRNLFMIIDPLEAGGVKVDAQGTTLDVGPTVLHALGYQASLGLGRDLLAGEMSLSQALPNFNASLSQWKAPIAGFWGFSRLDELQINADERSIEAGGTTIVAPALIAFDEEFQAEVFFESSTRQKGLSEYLYALPKNRPFVWVVDCARARAYAEVKGQGADRDLCVIAGRRGATPVISERTGAEFEIDAAQLRGVLESRADANVHAEQTARLRDAQLPSGLRPLVASLPEGSVFFYSASERTSPYLRDFSKLPEVASRRLRWVTSLPSEEEFYFAAPSLNAVRKSRRYEVRRLAFGDDIVTILDRHARDVVVLSLKGDMKALSKNTIDRLARVGVDLEKLNRRGSFAAVLDANVPVAVATANDAPVVLASDALLERGIERVESAGRDFGNDSKVIVRGKNLSNNKRGLNMVILRRGVGPVALNIDTHSTERRYSDVYEATAK